MRQRTCPQAPGGKHAGPSGLLVAKSPDGKTTETDQSNVMLVAVETGRKKAEEKKAAAERAALKRPAGKHTLKKLAAKKKPSAAALVSEQFSDEEKSQDEGEQEGAPAADDEGKQDEGEQEGSPADAIPQEAAPAGPVPGRRYGLDWYKKDCRVGVKLRHGKMNQLFSFGGVTTKGVITKDELMEIGRKICDRMRDRRGTDARAHSGALERLIIRM